MWNIDAYRLLASEKITLALQEAQRDRQVRALQEAQHDRVARAAAAKRVMPSTAPAAPAGTPVPRTPVPSRKEEPQTA